MESETKLDSAPIKVTDLVDQIKSLTKTKQLKTNNTVKSRELTTLLENAVQDINTKGVSIFLSFKDILNQFQKFKLRVLLYISILLESRKIELIGL